MGDTLNNNKLENLQKFFTPAYAKMIWLSYNQKEWREMPVNFIEFAVSEEYLGLGSDVYLEIARLGYDITSGDFTEVVLLVGIGSGKSFLAQALSCYIAYKVLCLRDPHKYFGLTKDKPIEWMNMGINATQAKDVVFTGIVSLVANSLWFKTLFDRHDVSTTILKTEIAFEADSGHGNIKFPLMKLISGNSKESAPIGRNLIGGILDEAAFYLDNDSKSVAEGIYEKMVTRVTSRFKDKGLVIVISSIRDDEDFITMKYEQSQRDDIKSFIYGYRGKTWQVQDRVRFEKEVFLFNFQELQIIEMTWEQIQDYLNEWQIQHLSFDDERDNTYWIIPNEFRKSFIKSPEMSARDFGSLAVSSLEGFIKSRQFIYDSQTIENRVDEYGIWHIENPIASPLYIHVDLALNRTDSADCGGIAASYCSGIDKEGMPLVETPFVERMTRGEKKEIDFAEVRNKIINLKNAGWIIGLVTFDGFQSVDSIQILNNKGIPAEYLSLDRTLEPYNTFRGALYENRLKFPKVIIEDPKKKGRKIDIAKKEMEQLMLVKGKKVDHPANGSKDVADGIAGSVYNVIRAGHTGGSQSMIIR